MGPARAAVYGAGMIPHRTRYSCGVLALAFVLSACSSESSSGVHVELMAVRSVSGGEPLPAGTGVLRVDELRWTSTEIELLGCPSAYRTLTRWLLPEAHAHGNSTPTLSAVPVIVNGVSTDAATPARIGNLQPPAGRYCSLRYRIGPADGDALGLATAPAMLEHSFLLRGASGPSEAELQPLELLSARILDVTLPVELELSRERPEVSLSFVLDSERWLSALDASALAAGGEEDALLDAFSASLAVQVE